MPEDVRRDAGLGQGLEYGRDDPGLDQARIGDDERPGLALLGQETRQPQRRAVLA